MLPRSYSWVPILAVFALLGESATLAQRSEERPSYRTKARTTARSTDLRDSISQRLGKRSVDRPSAAEVDEDARFLFHIRGRRIWQVVSYEDIGSKYRVVPTSGRTLTVYKRVVDRIEPVTVVARSKDIPDDREGFTGDPPTQVDDVPEKDSSLLALRRHYQNPTSAEADETARFLFHFHSGQIWRVTAYESDLEHHTVSLTDGETRTIYKSIVRRIESLETNNHEADVVGDSRDASVLAESEAEELPPEDSPARGLSPRMVPSTSPQPTDNASESLVANDASTARMKKDSAAGQESSEPDSIARERRLEIPPHVASIDDEESSSGSATQENNDDAGSDDTAQSPGEPATVQHAPIVEDSNTQDYLVDRAGVDQSTTGNSTNQQMAAGTQVSAGTWLYATAWKIWGWFLSFLKLVGIIFVIVIIIVFLFAPSGGGGGGSYSSSAPAQMSRSELRQ